MGWYPFGMRKVFMLSFLILAVCRIWAAAAPEESSIPGKEQKMDATKSITEKEALDALRQAWDRTIRQEVQANGDDVKSFEYRLRGTEDELKLGSFTAEQKPFPDTLGLIRKEHGPSPAHFLYGGLNRFPAKGICWILTWENQLSGGYVAYVDAMTAEVIAIEVLIEG
jgi:hypothetical protein